MNPPKPAGTVANGRTCPQCGAALATGALGGLCPACLLHQGAATDTATQPEAKPFVPPTVEELGRLFPQFEVLALLGKGGMGAVYKARQPALDRFVALKILAAQAAADAGFPERFTREARALARLNRPHIVAVHEFGQVRRPGAAAAVGAEPSDAVLHYFLMEFVDGVNLRQLQLSGRLSPREALQIVPQICDALQYAHDEGVVHRDIKPENVLVDRKGRVKIADFGLAKILGLDPQDLRLTGEGQVMGTPHYMAPEQVEHPLAVDHRADIYALGVVFYEMLTGELPLGRFAPPSRKVRIDVRLDEIVLHALEKEPERRYQKASEVKTAVEDIAGTPTETARGPAARPQTAGRDQRTKGGIFGLPWVHVASGIDPTTGRPRVAKGIVAVGPTAFGVVAVGIRACGVLATGVVACGLFPTGVFALGLLAVGLVSVGGIESVGLCAAAFRYAAGLVAVAPVPTGIAAIRVGFGSPALVVALAAVAAWFLVRPPRGGVRLLQPQSSAPVSAERPATVGPRSHWVLGAAVGFSVFTLVTLVTTLVTVFLPESYQATARVEIELIAPAHPAIRPPFDPYFLQTEFEVIRSKAVLAPAIERLGLRARWGQTYGAGSSPTVDQAAALLRETLTIRLIRGTSLIEIGAFSDRAAEAAERANAIAESYAQYRSDQVRAFEEASRKAAADVVAPASAPTLVRVEIVDRAEPPLLPIRPNKPLNIVVGQAVGVGLGALAGAATAGVAWRRNRRPSAAELAFPAGGPSGKQG